MKKFKRKVLDMLMSNNSGSNLRQQLFDGAPFCSELLYTAVPQRAASGTTGTFTRATTKTWKNNDGYLVKGVAGEIGFVGARRVRNLLTFTEDFSNAAWVKPTGCTIGSNVVANPINGALTADKIIPPVSASFHSVYQSYSLSGATHNYSIYLKNAGYNFAYISPDGGTSGVTINLTTGATTTTGSVTAAATSVGNGWWRVSCLSSVTTNTIRVYPGSTTAPESFTGDGTSGIYAWGAQLEDVTAQTTQTAGEYVSVGVPADWAGTELVTNGTFDTGTTGWTTKNAASISVGSGKLRITNGVFGGAEQVVTTLAGAKYVVSRGFTAGTSTACITQIGTTPGGNDLYDSGIVSTANLSAEFTATSTTTYVQVYLGDGTGGNYAGFDNISVKPAYYHGSFVDGVKCFPTDISGNPIPSTTLLGYLAEGARTNIALQSQTIATAPWQIGNGIAVTADQYVAPDGTTTVDKLTALAGNTQHFWYQQVTTTAAVHTYSVYLRYVNNQWARIGVYDGVGSFYAAFDILNGVVGSTVGAVTATTIEPVGDGVTWRVSLTGTFAASALSQIYLSVVNADDPSFELWNAVGTEAIGAWGAQFELGSFASSYIATTTVAVKRNADVLTYSGGDIPNLKTIMAGFRCAPGVNTGAARVVASLSPGASIFAEYIDAGSFQLGATDFWFQGIDNNVVQWATQCSNTYTPGTSAKAASSWATNDIKMSFNGVAQTADTVATMPTVTTLYVGSGSGIAQLNGNVGPIYGWTRNQSQSELNAITS